MIGFCMEQTTTNMPFGIKMPPFSTFSMKTGEFLCKNCMLKLQMRFGEKSCPYEIQTII